MLFSRKPKEVEQTPIWHLGDFVRVVKEETPYGVLDHAGEIGVIVAASPPTKSEKSAAYGMGWYYKVWFGPFKQPGFESLDQTWNWRGYYDGWLEDIDESSKQILKRG